MSDPMSDWGNSNVRPLVPETWVQSPNRLYRQVDNSLGYGGPGETRTHNLQLRRLTRYPLRYGSKFVRRTDQFSFYPFQITLHSIRYGWLALARTRRARGA